MSSSIIGLDSYDKLSEIAPDWQAVKSIVGEKAGNLCSIFGKESISVPNGFVIVSEETKRAFEQSVPDITDSLFDSIKENVISLEEKTGKTFGSDSNPLFLSVRLSTAVPLFGLGETVLNVGLNDTTVVSFGNMRENLKFAWDLYKSFVFDYGTRILKIAAEDFEERVSSYMSEKSQESEQSFQSEDVETVVGMYKEVIQEKSGQPFPQDVYEQLRKVISFVLESYTRQEIKLYLSHMKMERVSPAIIIQAQVFGNLDEVSCCGTLRTRSPITGESRQDGIVMMSSQGTRIGKGGTGESLSKLESAIPDAYAKLLESVRIIEKHFFTVKEIEFTVESGELYILQLRDVEVRPEARMKMLVDFAAEDIIERRAVLERFSYDDFMSFYAPAADKNDEDLVKIASGEVLSYGNLEGSLIFSPEQADPAKNCILICSEVSMSSLENIFKCKAIVLDKRPEETLLKIIQECNIPLICGVGSLNFETQEEGGAVNLVVGESNIKEGDVATFDDSTASLYVGKLKLVNQVPEETPEFAEVLKIADEVCSQNNCRQSRNFGPTSGLKIFVNVRGPDDIEKAKANGAIGVGLYTTEQLLLGERSEVVQKLVDAEEEDEIDGALGEIEESLTGEVSALIEAFSPNPVVIRLADCSLSEFMPSMLETATDIASIKERLKHELDADEDELKEKRKLMEKLKVRCENNPLYGGRGCRFDLTHENLIQAQIKAIMNAACSATENEIEPNIHIMIPLVVSEEEVIRVKLIAEGVITEVLKEREIKSLPVKFGACIQAPRAAIILDRISSVCDFVCFHCEDLTMFSIGAERRGKTITRYLEKGILRQNPFNVLDVSAERLIRIGTERARAKNNNLFVGVCGDCISNLKATDVMLNIGIDFVSCTVPCLPLARFSAAKSVLSIH